MACEGDPETLPEERRPAQRSPRPHDWGISMHARRSLEDEGFVLVGQISLEPPSIFTVHFDRPNARVWMPVIYGFRIGGQVVRIGSTTDFLMGRMCQWEMGVTRALAGRFRKNDTNPWEAFEWRRLLTEHGYGEFLARQGKIDDEWALIRYHNPPLCDDSPCAEFSAEKGEGRL